MVGSYIAIYSISIQMNWLFQPTTCNLQKIPATYIMYKQPPLLKCLVYVVVYFYPWYNLASSFDPVYRNI